MCSSKSPASDFKSLLRVLRFTAAATCVAASKCVVSAVGSGVLMMRWAGPLVLEAEIRRAAPYHAPQN
jgi:hypothetical protein